VNDVEVTRQIQATEETHRLTVRQMVVTHSNELEHLTSKIHELQHELQTKSVSVNFWQSVLCAVRSLV